MVEVLVIMTLGIALGALLRTRKQLIKTVNKTTIWIIFILLFFMGVTVGGNAEIMNNLDTIGLRGLQLSFVAILGSVILSWVVYKLFFNGNDSSVNTIKEGKHER